MAHDPHELLTAFSRRWQRIGPRLARHGHRVDVPRLMKTMSLIRQIDGGHAEAFSIENWTHSHHLPSCAFSSRRNPPSRVSTAAEDQWHSL